MDVARGCPMRSLLPEAIIAHKNFHFCIVQRVKVVDGIGIERVPYLQGARRRFVLFIMIRMMTLEET